MKRKTKLRMEVLQSLQNYLALLGLDLNQSLFNVKFFMAEFFMFTNIGCNWLFIIFEANTFREYANSSFLNSTYTMAAICFTIFAVERKHVIKITEIGTELLEESKINLNIKKSICENATSIPSL